MSLSRVFLLLFGALFCVEAFGEIKVEYRANRIQGFYNFVETISGNQHRSRVIKDLFENSSFNNDKYKNLIKELNIAGAALDEGFSYKGYPPSRHMGQSLDLIFVIRSAYSKDLDDFSSRTIGLLPLADHKRFFEILREFEPVYEALIWKTNSKKLLSYKTKLEKFSKDAHLNQLFHQATKFYGAEWPSEVPFIVGLYPIPGARGHSSAESLGSFLSLGVLVDEKDLAGRFGVLFHEMCHSLYEAQNIKLMNEIESTFVSSKSKFAAFTYSTLNEGLATAIGNGWAFEKATGKQDDGEWYNEKYTNGFARAIFPLVESYLKDMKTIDVGFINGAIDIFSQTFPNAHYDYEKLLISAILATDGTDIKTRESGDLLRKYFRINSMSRSSPIDDEETLKILNESKDTMLILLTSKNKHQLSNLSKKVPSLKSPIKLALETKENFILSTFDEKNRAFIIIQLDQSEKLEMAIKQMKMQAQIDPQKPLVLLK